MRGLATKIQRQRFAPFQPSLSVQRSIAGTAPSPARAPPVRI
jgi:hypothetical protein